MCSVCHTNAHINGMQSLSNCSVYIKKESDKEKCRIIRSNKMKEKHTQNPVLLEQSLGQHPTDRRTEHSFSTEIHRLY